MSTESTIITTAENAWLELCKTKAAKAIEKTGLDSKAVHQ